MTERFEATTTVRRPRVVLMWTLLAAMGVLMGLSWFFHFGRSAGPFLQLPWWLVGPALAWIQRRPKIETLAVAASADGVRAGSRTVPRAKLKSAVLRREGARTFVLLRGSGSMGLSSLDVEVPNDAAADRLCSALALDAKSTTAEFQMVGATPSRTRMRALLAAMGAAIAACFMAIILKAYLLPIVMVVALGLGLVIGLPFLIFANRTKLLVGADGIVVKEGLRARRFVSHDELASVAAKENNVILERNHGEKMTFSVGTDRPRNTPHNEELRLQAQSIAWRIEKAREAYRALAGSAPQAALALDRGGKSTHEWIEQLKRIGEGANATFRDVALTREQLLGVVESTSASARERLAAAVALRVGLTDDEKPRIRVAADRCAEPALRERMVRVAFAPSDEELVAALEEERDVSASGVGATR